MVQIFRFYKHSVGTTFFLHFFICIEVTLGFLTLSFRITVQDGTDQTTHYGKKALVITQHESCMGEAFVISWLGLCEGCLREGEADVPHRLFSKRCIMKSFKFSFCFFINCTYKVKKCRCIQATPPFVDKHQQNENVQ